jgi:ATP-binding cassette subfamily B protein
MRRISGPSHPALALPRQTRAVPAPRHGLRSRLRALVAADAAGAQLVAAAPALPLREVVRRFWPDARPYRRWIAAGLVVALLIPVVEAAEIWMFKLVVDEVLVPRDLGPFAAIALATLGIVLARGALGFVDEYLAAWIGERFVLDLRTRVFRHLQTLSPEALERRRMGDTLERVTGDVEAIEVVVVSGVAEALSAVVRIIVFVGLLVYLDPLLAAVAVVAAPLLWMVAGRFSTLVRQTSREARRRGGALNAVGEESLANAGLVQAYGLEDAEARRFRSEGEGILRAEMAAARIKAAFTPVVDLIELGAALLVIGMGTWAVADGRLTIGGLLVFLAYLTQLYSPVRELGSLATSVFSAAAAAERVDDLLSERPSVTDPEVPDTAPSPVRGRMALEGVTFRYPGAGAHVLHGADLVLAPGEVVAVVGANGAGKSTIAKLLVRFHDPEAGAVTLDGVDARRLPLAALRGAVTLLPQEPLVFHGTVRENVALGRPGASQGELEAAARAAGAAAMIAALPEGWDTVVGQRGRRLSGGQRQLVAIARALLRDAPVLVLDEPTTGLDARARAHLRGPLRAVMAGRTALVVSHDPEMIACADRVVRLEGGRLVPAGRPVAA